MAHQAKWWVVVAPVCGNMAVWCVQGSLRCLPPQVRLMQASCSPSLHTRLQSACASQWGHQPCSCQGAGLCAEG